MYYIEPHVHEKDEGNLVKNTRIARRFHLGDYGTIIITKSIGNTGLKNSLSFHKNLYESKTIG